MRARCKGSRYVGRSAPGGLILIGLLVTGCPAEPPAEPPPLPDREQAARAATSTPAAREPCENDEACEAYLREVRGRVLASWEALPEVTPGFVVAEIRFDEVGNPTVIAMAEATDPGLEKSCLEAFKNAEPFPTPPASIVGQALRIRFIYGDHEAFPKALLADLKAKLESATDPESQSRLTGGMRTLEKVIAYWEQHPSEPLPDDLRKEYVGILEEI